MPRAALSCALPFMLLFAVATGARAQDFTGFRIPDHRVLSWTGDLSGDAQQVRSNGDFHSDRHRVWAGGASTQIVWLTDSERSRSRITVRGSFSGQRTRSESHSESATAPDYFSDRRDHGPSTSELLALDVGQRRYPWRVPIGFEMGASSVGFFSQRWMHHDAVTHFPGGDSYENRGDQEDFRTSVLSTLNATLGYGRVRDATPVYEAWVLEDRLRETGSLTRPLSVRARRRLAEIMALRSSYQTALERPGRSIWDEVEKLLEDDGALEEGGLDAFSLLRAGETLFDSYSFDGLPRSPISRETGWFAGPAFVLRNESDRHHSTSFDQSKSFNADTLVWSSTFTERRSGKGSQTSVLAGPRVEFHRPIGVRWQLDAEANGLLPLRKEETGWEVSSNLALGWIAGDRWLATLKAQQSRWIRKGETQFDPTGSGWYARIGGTVRYFIEDHLALLASVYEEQTSERAVGSYPPAGLQRNLRMHLGLSYTFTGRLTAPGLVAAVRTPRALSD